MKHTQPMKRITALLLSFAIIFTGLGISAWNLDEVYAVQADSSNMNIINDAAVAAAVPTSAGGAELKWATSVGSGYANATTEPLAIGDKLFILGGGKLKEIDKETGAVKNTSADTIKNARSYFLETDGTNIYLMQGTKVSAYNQDLTKVWDSETFSGNQGLSPLYYDSASGNIYGATVSTLASSVGEFFCIKASDGKRVWKKEATRGDSEAYCGSYWAGAIVIGDYALFGSEKGTIYSFNKITGDEVSTTGKSQDGTENVRSSITYSNGNIYYTTRTGYICKVAFDSTNGTFGALTSAKIDENATESISTPVVYNGRIYVSASTSTGTKAVVGVLNESNLSNIYSVPLNSNRGGTIVANKGHNVALVVDSANDRVIGYTSYYDTPGGITGFIDKDGQTEANEFNLGSLLTGIAEQNSAAQVVVGNDGTIYGSNDSGKLFAIEKNEAYLSSLNTSVGNFKTTFKTSDTEYVNVVPAGTDTVKLTFTPSSGATVTVNNNDANNGEATLTLVDGKVSAEIKVTKGTYTRTYTVEIREEKNLTTINVATTTSNSISANFKPVQSAGNNTYVIYNAKVDNRLWFSPQDSDGTITGWATLEGSSKNIASVTTSNVGGDGNTYANRVFYSGTSTAYPTIATCSVVAENGEDSQQYYFILTDKADESEVSFPKSLSLDRETMTLGGLYNKTGKITATTEFIGTATPTETVVWTSSDNSVATVDGNGNVTAVAKGTATITATFGHLTKTCTVKVNEKADPIRAYVTIADSGKIATGKNNTAMAQAPVTVDDLNQDGIFTVDEVLYAAHKQYYTGGVLAGYATEDGDYGLAITKLWGDTSGYFGYWLNNNSCWSLGDEVKAGDYVNAFIYADKTGGWSDLYTAFDEPDQTITEGGEVTVTLNGYTYDNQSYGYVPTPLADTTVRVLDADNNVIGGYKTDENGKVTVSFSQPGVYYLESASDEVTPVTRAPGVYIIPNATKVVVTAQTNSSTGGNPAGNIAGNTLGGTSGDNQLSTGSVATPLTGDNSQVMWWMLIGLVAILSLLSVTLVRRKEYNEE